MKNLFAEVVMAPNNDGRHEPGSGAADYSDTTPDPRRRRSTAAMVTAVAVAMVVAIVGALALVRMSSTGDDLPRLRVGSAQQSATGEKGAADLMWDSPSFSVGRRRRHRSRHGVGVALDSTN